MSEDGFEDLRERSKDIERYRRAFNDIENCIERIEWEFVKQKGKELMEEFRKTYTKFNRATSQIAIDNEAFHKGDISQSQFEKKRAGIIEDLSNVDLELSHINLKLRDFIDKVNDFIEKGGVVEEKKAVIDQLNDALTLLCEKLDENVERNGQSIDTVETKKLNKHKEISNGKKNDGEYPEGTNGAHISLSFTKILNNISSKRGLIVCAIFGIFVIAIYGVFFTPKVSVVMDFFTPKVPVVMDFTADRTSGIDSLNSVYFNSTVTGNPTKYCWEFERPGEDWRSFHRITALHSFHEPGTYDVSLTVENELGNSKLTKKNYIKVIPKENVSIVPTTSLPTRNVEVPIVKDFSANVRSGSLKLYNVQFTSTVSGNPTSYYWVFEPPNNGDWNSSKAITALHSFHEPGTYDVSLTVENELGNSTLLKKDYIKVEG